MIGKDDKITLEGSLIAAPIENRAGEPAARLTLAGSKPGGAENQEAPGARPQRRRYHGRFVRAGRVAAPGGLMGDIEVQSEALFQAVQAGLFDHKAVFIDHAGLAGGSQSVERLVGVTGAAVFSVDSVEGEIELYETPLAQAAASLLDDLLLQGEAAPDVGLSIVFYPIWEHDQRTRRVVGIQAVESVDLVFQPAADGRILAALANHSAQQAARLALGALEAGAAQTGGLLMSENENRNPQTGAREALDPTSRNSAAPKPGVPAGFSPPDGFSAPARANPATETWTQAGSNPQVTAYAPAGTCLPTAAHQPPGNSAFARSTAPAGQGVALGNEAPAAQPPWEFLSFPMLPQTLVDQIVASSGLPAAARARLSNRPYASTSTLDGEINAERAYLAELSADRVVQLPGSAPRSGRLGAMVDSLDRIGLALEALIAGARPPDNIQPLTGIREAYHILSGDYEMAGLFHPERVQFANVNSSTMAALVANAMNKRLINEFQQYPQWWAPVVSVEDFATLQDVRWITLGGVGELPTVVEGAAYTELTWDDKTETAAFVKKGGYLGITLEAIDKDDVGRLRAAPRALAQAAWLTLSKAIASIFTSNSGTGPTVSDSTALFTSGHGNLGSTALSVSSFAAARLAMRKQTELNSGERLGALTAPKFLLVPPDLEITALQVLASENDYTYALSNAPAAPANVFAEGDGFNSRMQAARGRVIVIDLWTDSNDWAAVADPRMYPTIGLGFRYGRTPEIFSVASPTAGLMFSNDTMPIKARFFFAAGPVDWKGVYKANVA